MEKLNGAMIRELFEREAVFFANLDGVSEWRVVQIFGKDAVDFAKHMAPNSWGGYGIGDYTEYYLTLKGFQIAATYNNIRRIKEDRKA